jgi:Flp pilus assembly protein TadG
MTRGVSSDESGASAVEFALILPLFLLLVFGMIDFGRAYNMQMTLTDAAREGVRPLALRVAGANATAATRAAIPASWAGAVSVSSVGCPTGLLTAPVPNASVTATTTFRFLTPGLGAIANFASRGHGSSLGAPILLTGRGVMRCGG